MEVEVGVSPDAVPKIIPIAEVLYLLPIGSSIEEESGGLMKRRGIV